MWGYAIKLQPRKEAALMAAVMVAPVVVSWAVDPIGFLYSGGLYSSTACNASNVNHASEFYLSDGSPIGLNAITSN